MAKIKFPSLSVPVEPSFRAAFVFALCPGLYGLTSPRFSSHLDLKVTSFLCLTVIFLDGLWRYFSLVIKGTQDAVVQVSRAASAERKRMNHSQFALRVLLLYSAYGLLTATFWWFAILLFSGKIAVFKEMLICALLLAIAGAVGAFALSLALDRHYQTKP